MSKRDADEYRRLVFKRTGLNAATLRCPREKSSMTPCIARDGNTAVAISPAYGNVCVGCGAAVESLLTEEQKKHPRTA